MKSMSLRSQLSLLSLLNPDTLRTSQYLWLPLYVALVFSSEQLHLDERQNYKVLGFSPEQICHTQHLVGGGHLLHTRVH